MLPHGLIKPICLHVQQNSLSGYKKTLVLKSETEVEKGKIKNKTGKTKIKFRLK